MRRELFVLDMIGTTIEPSFEGSIILESVAELQEYCW